jgi:hypothetical protein
MSTQGGEHLQLSRQERLVLALQHQGTRSENFGLVSAQGPVEGHVILLGDVGAGRDDAMEQIAVVGHQQQPRRFLVEAPHRRERRVTPAPAIGQ